MTDADPVAQFGALTELRKLLASHRELPIQATIEYAVRGLFFLSL